MKWGVRRSNPSATGPVDVTLKTIPGKRVKTSGGKRLPASEDAIKAAVAKQKARSSTTDSLSDRELQTLVQRMNLEQQYARLKGDSGLAKGQKFVKDLLGLGKTAQEAYNVGSSITNDIAKALK